VVPGPHRAVRRIPPRATGPGPRTGPDPPPQGRAGPHHRGRREHVAGPTAPPRRPLPRRGQTQDPILRTPRGGVVPPPRGGRGPHDPRSHEGAALLVRR